MIINHIQFAEDQMILRPGSSNPATRLEDFTHAALVWGTRGDTYTRCGTYRPPEGAPLVCIITNKPERYYMRKYGIDLEIALDNHCQNRFPAWLARGFIYGFTSLGVVMCAVGVSAPVGALFVAKGAALGAAAGAAAGTVGGCAHTRRSSAPFLAQRFFLETLDDMISYVRHDVHQPWMLDNAEIARRRAIAPTVFDHAIFEMHLAGHTMGRVVNLNRDWTTLREIGLLRDVPPTDGDPDAQWELPPPPAYRDDAHATAIEMRPANAFSRPGAMTALLAADAAEQRRGMAE